MNRARVYFKAWPEGTGPVVPALRPGQRVQCNACHASTADVRAVLAEPWGFLCRYCAAKARPWNAWNLPAGDVAGWIREHAERWTCWGVHYGAPGLALADPPSAVAVVYGPPTAEDLDAVGEGRGHCTDCARPMHGPDYGFGRRAICGTCARDYI